MKRPDNPGSPGRRELQLARRNRWASTATLRLSATLKGPLYVRGFADAKTNDDGDDQAGGQRARHRDRAQPPERRRGRRLIASFNEDALPHRLRVKRIEARLARHRISVDEVLLQILHYVTIGPPKGGHYVRFR